MGLSFATKRVLRVNLKRALSGGVVFVNPPDTPPPGTTNAAPWDAVPWAIPGLTDTDVGKRIATGSLVAANTITETNWNGTGYNDLYRWEDGKTIYVHNPDVVVQGYDFRGYCLYIKEEAHRAIIVDNLFDTNCNPSGSQTLWYGSITNETGATAVEVHHNDFIGDGVMAVERNCIFIRHMSPVTMKRIYRNKFVKTPNDAINTEGCDLIDHNYFYGVGYGLLAHGDGITVNANRGAGTVIEYNHIDLYGDGLFAEDAPNNTVRLNTENGPNTTGVEVRFNTHKGGGWQHELDLEGGANFVFHDEYRLLRNGAPHYPVVRADEYTGPFGGMTTDVGSPVAGKLRYYNQTEVDWDGNGNDRALAEINRP